MVDRNITGFVELKYSELYEPKEKAEVVIFGASRGMRAINPAFLDLGEKKCYNFCYQGANPEFMFEWYNRLFKKHYPKPETIIYTVDWMMFDESWMERKIEHDSEFLTISDFFSWVFLPDSLNPSDLIFNRLVLRKDIFNVRYLFSEKTDFLPDEMEKYDRGYVPRNEEFFITPRKKAKFKINVDISQKLA